MLGGVFSLAVQELVGELLKPFKAQIGTADHQQRCDQPRNERTDRQRRRHQDQFIDERTLGDRPDHRDFPFGTHATDLLSVERQVVTEYAGRFLGGHLGHQGHVIQHGRDVVDQHQQTASCHESGFLLQ
ncbi:hypothetical protein D3C81_1228810 [compost metagenome]